MVKMPLNTYTLAPKQEVVRLVESGQPVSEAARSLGVAAQTLSNLCQGASGGQVAQLWEPHGVDSQTNGDPASARRTVARRRWSTTSWKSHGVLCEGSEMKYAFIDRQRSVWPVCVQCRVLGVSATGYSERGNPRRAA
jgi:hypothetical protein